MSKEWERSHQGSERPGAKLQPVSPPARIRAVHNSPVSPLTFLCKQWVCNNVAVGSSPPLLSGQSDNCGLVWQSSINVSFGLKDHVLGRLCLASGAVYGGRLSTGSKSHGAMDTGEVACQERLRIGHTTRIVSLTLRTSNWPPKGTIAWTSWIIQKNGPRYGASYDTPRRTLPAGILPPSQRTCHDSPFLGDKWNWVRMSVVR